MDLEERILRYCLSLFSLVLILIYFIHLFAFKPIYLEENKIIIDKGSPISKIIENSSIKNNFLEKKLFTISLILYNKLYSQINFGKFKIKKNSSFIDIIKIISKKSNIDYRLTIIEGWEKYQLNHYLGNIYINFEELSYTDLIANTYIINSSNNFKQLKIFLNNKKNDFFKKYINNEIIEKYGIKKVLIIASLVEKESKTTRDKKLITSVIFNRLRMGMKLQIDATVISSITNGKFKLDRSLQYKDLKISHPLNTYKISGLPQEMISYVGEHTIKIVLDNPKSDFLFYFYNILEKKHIFSNNYSEHKDKLNDYRKKRK